MFIQTVQEKLIQTYVYLYKYNWMSIYI